MSSDPTIERMLARYEPKRREALRRILLGTAIYTAPLVASYSMQSLGGDAQAQALCQNQTLGNCAQPVPVDAGVAIVAAVGVVGAAGAFMLRRRRERKDRDDKA
jgi:MYXO-CTERM domain-containing protein